MFFGRGQRPPPGIPIALLFALMLGACSRTDRKSGAGDARTQGTASTAPLPSGVAGVDGGGTPRPGMAWIPGGTLRAGTPAGRTPRIADEEMAGVPVEMGGFYVDLLPWPNEPNAIPTSNVSRDEAEQLCASRGKRLCTELEWERACKGPESTTYEYGDVYRKDACGTGIALEQASRRPTGEHAQCKSGFGVAEMHGGVWEWTSSAWGRGSADASQGVLRGGNSLAGELVGRCANAIARAPTKKSPTMGFRCCAGPKNAAEVKLSLVGVPGLAAGAPHAGVAWGPAIAAAAGAGARVVQPKTIRSLTWIPVHNEELVIVLGCTQPPRACGLIVGRPRAAADGGAGDVLASVATGAEIGEVARNGDARHLRMRSLDPRGVSSRDITYLYGRVELGESKRP